MARGRKDLFKEIKKLHQEAERQFFEFLSPSRVVPSVGRRWQPLADVYETDLTWVIKMELAGVRREDLSVTVHEGILTVRGVRRDEFEGGWRTYHQAEIDYKEFERSFSVPEELEEGDIEATYHDGLLTLTIRKPTSPSRQARAVRIQIT